MPSKRVRVQMVGGPWDGDYIEYNCHPGSSMLPQVLVPGGIVNHVRQSCLYKFRWYRALGIDGPREPRYVYDTVDQWVENNYSV